MSYQDCKVKRPEKNRDDLVSDGKAQDEGAETGETFTRSLGEEGKDDDERDPERETETEIEGRHRVKCRERRSRLEMVESKEKKGSVVNESRMEDQFKDLLHEEEELGYENIQGREKGIMDVWILKSVDNCGV
ncbi:hypothetical protein PPACK8108_LOCUS3972 [Phakopsora pachyrhizi]|uniref:Uncharacterized protein n=1 Tax=Phakopsora pachyrhizi TaxID=170000 RepID=A0AAV0AMA5_PHAPC|nr:hypothetical protein PPACK8108_LOCUS3972 [Phakopsora pachyrhizi]